MDSQLTKAGAKKTAGKTTQARSRKRPPTQPGKSDLTVSLPQFLNEGSDVQFREFVAVLFAMVTGMHSLRRAIAKSVGLSAAEFSVLLAVWHIARKGDARIVTIAKHLHIAAAHVTAEVGQLVDKGLLDRTPDPNDTRAVLIGLTPAGRNILSRLAPLLRDINDRLFSRYDAESFALLNDFVRHLADETSFTIQLANAFKIDAS